MKNAYFILKELKIQLDIETQSPTLKMKAWHIKFQACVVLNIIFIKNFLESKVLPFKYLNIGFKEI